ncbi:MAG: gamma carbonic anhydrase family protein [Lachnospiraceae bacterium]|nr:gamma carbonic anhydrase family protein [Lachnospiraceae bacterium]
MVENANIIKMDGAVVRGDVSIGDNTVIWYNAVVRGDGLPVTIGKNCHIEDNSVLHSGIFYPIAIGDGVTVGHGAIVHGCTVGDNSLIGMGSILMDDCHIGRDSIVAAGSLVPQHKSFPDGVLIMGSPAEVKRKLSENEVEGNRKNIKACFEMAENNFAE